MLKSKLIVAVAAFAVVIGSSVAYQLVTGRCALSAFCNAIHGDKPASGAPSN